MSYRRELEKYRDLDEDEILGALTEEELRTLENELDELDPDNRSVPRAEKCRPQEPLQSLLEPQPELCFSSDLAKGSSNAPTPNTKVSGLSSKFPGPLFPLNSQHPSPPPRRSTGRCLVEKGDVAFVKETTVFQNTEGKNPEAWAKDLKQEDFELLCLDGTRRPVTEAHRCHLAIVPNHAVVSRKDKAASVRRMLFNQQELFGRNGFEYRMFQMFQSSSKDLLFSDDTACLANLQDGTTYRKYLGPEYLKALDNMGQCLHSELQDACTFHVH